MVKVIFYLFLSLTKLTIMIGLFLPLIDWTMGIIGGGFLFAVFGGLAIMLMVFMRKPKGK